MSQPSHVQALPAPRCSPPGLPLPTHSEGAAERAGRRTPFVQDALAVDFATDAQLFGPQPTPAADLPDARGWAAHIAQGLVEVMHGSRPPAQVLRWTTPEVYALVSRRGALAARRAAARAATHRGEPEPPRRRTRVTRVLVCEPAPDVAEASVVLVDGRRVRALALRLVGRDGRWLVDALQVG